MLTVVLTVFGGAMGCSSAANAADLQVGDCLKMGGTVDRPDATKVECGSRESNCNDTSVTNRQRATQILTGVASVDQCASGQGYAYDQRQFTVCVENIA